MALTITSEPIRTIDGVTSAANASRSQIPFILTTTTSQTGKLNFKFEVQIVDTSGVALITTIFKYSPKADDTLFLVGKIEFPSILLLGAM